MVRQLLRRVEALPPFTQATRRLPEETRAVRGLLRAATDPRALLLDDLPRALHVDLSTRNGPAAFAAALGKSANRLDRAFANLLGRIETQVRNAFGLTDRGERLRAALARRAAPLRECAGNPRLRLFLNEATRSHGGNGHDWREMLARAALDGKPPAHWRDEDEALCGARMRTLAAECDTLTELVAATGGDASATVATIALLEPGSAGRRAVVACPDTQRAPVAKLTRALRRAAQGSNLDDRSKLLALVLAARDLLPGGANPDAPAAHGPSRGHAAGRQEAIG